MWGLDCLKRERDICVKTIIPSQLRRLSGSTPPKGTTRSQGLSSFCPLERDTLVRDTLGTRLRHGLRIFSPILIGRDKILYSAE